MIYVIEARGTGLVKIGKANHIGIRLSDLRTGSPVELDIVCILEGGLAEERALHVALATHRHHGEWFERTASLAHIEPLAKLDLSSVDIEPERRIKLPCHVCGVVRKCTRKSVGRACRKCANKQTHTCAICGALGAAPYNKTERLYLCPQHKGEERYSRKRAAAAVVSAKMRGNTNSSGGRDKMVFAGNSARGVPMYVRQSELKDCSNSKTGL